MTTLRFTLALCTALIAHNALPSSAHAFTAIAVGDMAKCEQSFWQKISLSARSLWDANAIPNALSQYPTAQVADLVATIDHDLFLLLGDLAYDHGTKSDFKSCFDPIWGGLMTKAAAVPGNHEYYTNEAAPFYAYTKNKGIRTSDTGYYSFDQDEWHIVALNTNLSGEAMAKQTKWLHDDLAANDKVCTLTFGHHPRRSSFGHGDNEAIAPLFHEMASAGVELYLVGHDHGFEVFPSLGADGQPNTSGVKQFTIGTGGYPDLKGHAQRGQTTNELILEQHGVLKLSLDEGAYRWAFINVDGNELTTGTAPCS